MNKLIVLVGLPGAGKSTYAKQRLLSEECIIVSTDEIRAELGDINDQSNNKVFSIAHERITAYLEAGKTVIFDATNMTRKSRKKVLDCVPKDCLKECVIVYEPLEVCLQRNAARDRKVPEDVIYRMLKSFSMPTTLEGFNSVELYSTTPKSKDWMKDLLIKDYDMDQGNHHHRLTLGQHQHRVGIILNDYDRFLAICGSIHDCGKPLCKFYDEEKQEYRYFGHENVGAYLVLGYNFSVPGYYVNPLAVALLVNMHMMPYQWNSIDNPKELEDKYRKLWGDELFNDVMLLHKADKAAH